MSKPTSTTTGAAVPAPRTATADPATVARQGLAAVREATARLDAAIAGLDDDSAAAPSRLPGWTRGHVVTHLARNADALVNLLTWARTGVEHPMYASKADRDADIEEGAQRLAQIMHEDLIAACDRFETAAADLPDSAWQADLVARRPIKASEVTWLRMREVWLHLIDLDLGVEFADLPAEHLTVLLEDAVRTLNRDGVPAVRVETPDGTWTFGEGEQATVRGESHAVLAWLTRGDTSGIDGPAPTLPAWS